MRYPMIGAADRRRPVRLTFAYCDNVSGVQQPIARKSWEARRLYRHRADLGGPVRARLYQRRLGFLDLGGWKDLDGIGSRPGCFETGFDPTVPPCASPPAPPAA